MNDMPTAAGKSSFNLIDVNAFFNELPLKDNTIMTDLACGIGNYSLALYGKLPEGKIYAFDLWEEGIDILKGEIGKRNVSNISADIADISRNIPLPDNTVDLCLMATVLHDLIEDGSDGGAIGEASRICREDGVMAIVEFKKIDGPPGPPKSVRLSSEELRNYMNKRGWKEIKTVETGEYLYMSLFRR